MMNLLHLKIRSVGTDELILEEDESKLMSILGFLPTFNVLVRQTTKDPDFDGDLFLGAFHGGELVGCILGIRRAWKEKHRE